MLEAKIFNDSKYYTNIKELINPQVQPTQDKESLYNRHISLFSIFSKISNSIEQYPCFHANTEV